MSEQVLTELKKLRDEVKGRQMRLRMDAADFRQKAEIKEAEAGMCADHHDDLNALVSMLEKAQA